MKIPQKSIDSFCQKIKKEDRFDYPLARFARKYKNSSVLFSRYGTTDNFSTGALDIHFIKNNRRPNFKNMDGFLSFQEKIPVRYAIKNRRYIYETILERYGDWKNYLTDNFNIKEFFQGMPAVKMWNLSIVSALFLGMFLMSFIYHNLGQSAKADSEKNVVYTAPAEIVLGDNDEKEEIKTEDFVAEIIADYQKESANEKSIAEDIAKMTKGYPIEKMAPFIAQQDKAIAAFLIGIAKKESDWGKHVPVLKGEDCFNYWGYRGVRKKMGSGGHTCFNSPKDAVDTVAKRLKFLVSNEKLDTPKKMVVVWKCGYDCSWDSKEAVKKWVSDVDYYFKKFNDLDN